MKRFLFGALLVAAALGSTIAFAFSSGTASTIKSACGCVDCACPSCADGSCNGVCSCDVCTCGQCACDAANVTQTVGETTKKSCCATH